MGKTRYQVKYIVDLTIESDGDLPSTFMVKRAVETALRTLNQKKHKLGKVYPSAYPLAGSTAAALHLVETLREEMKERATDAVSSHEEQESHNCYE